MHYLQIVSLPMYSNTYLAWFVENFRPLFCLIIIFLIIEILILTKILLKIQKQILFLCHIKTFKKKKPIKYTNRANDYYTSFFHHGLGMQSL
jgi:hypothetical protein